MTLAAPPQAAAQPVPDPTALGDRARAVLFGPPPDGAGTTEATPRSGNGELLDGALGWLDANLAWFDPVTPNGRNRDPGGPAGSAVLELAVVCRSLGHRALSTPQRQVVDRGLDAAAEYFHRPGFPEGLLLRPDLFTYLAWLVVVLADSGRLPDRTRLHLVQRLVDAGFGDACHPSRHPHALLELRYVLELGGLRHDLPATADLYRRDVLHTPVDPLYVTDLEAYAVTHVVFYLTDFGARPLDARASVDGDAAVAVVDDLLALYLQSGHWDLTAELLSSRRALAAPPGPLACYAAACLRAAQCGDGRVPGPNLDPRQLARLDGDAADRYRFARCYHTTLVAALAAADGMSS